MFVSKRCFILKTCGSTTLLNAVQPLLYIVQELTGFNEVLDIFYSRKNFMRPELQNKPHTSFEDEVEVLDSLFQDGAAYCMGRINHDCWYLYTLNTPLGYRGFQVADQTLEVIMQDLDQKVMRIFTQEGASSARDATQKSGIDQLYPMATLDEYLFTPCGYSVNGILKGGYYFTIHITPEPDYSYVSFETNAPQPEALFVSSRNESAPINAGVSSSRSVQMLQRLLFLASHVASVPAECALHSRCPN
ncbi:hypothetical protein HPB51_001023 [Rhipicephalus microplus]|uniref:Adenosylmethionine decarboxylase n=1 Tax=Rhipicephalus microplus TaxID=6941 RepID=A0A9J6DEN6_RHIMP|nr:hypothetical protein HPB51_001023 [Rhipicephalus microplus]